MQTFLLAIISSATVANLIIFFVTRRDTKKEKEKEDPHKELDTKIAELSSLVSTLHGETISSMQEMRQALCRLQMLNLMEHHQGDVEALMSAAHKYFIELNGNWYMDGIFTDYCNDHNIPLPSWFEK